MAPLLCLLSLLLGPSAEARSTDADWRVVETEHYRLMYPVESEAWALDLAGRIDEMRDRVSEVVGYAPTRRTDVVVMDPWGDANGFAMPFARRPMMGVFTSAPGPESGIGNYRLWAEDLVVHEDAHLVHMTRPSRSPLGRLVFDRLLGVPPIAARAPGWVIEGYATLVEGRLTGAGRPNSDARPAFLRALARQGQLPTYDELDGSERWRSRSMRYLVGSAYLEWLAAEFGDAALPQLWSRMTAHRMRSFEAAFVGVFGAPPELLYGRFAAELTAGALAVERSEQPATLWADLSGELGAPAGSPDGSKLAFSRSPKRGPPQLEIWATAPDEEAEKKRAERIAEDLAKDLDDVAPLPPRQPPHAVVATFDHPGRVAVDPRWIDDERLLFSAWVTDGRGNRQPELFTWTVGSGRSRRLTRNQNLRDAEPCGDFAVAVQRRHGLSALVRVDLQSGAVEALTDPAPTRVEAGPRMDAACQQLAFLRNEGDWQVVLKHLGTGAEAVLPLPEGGQPLALDLRPDGSALVVALGVGGFAELWERPLPDGAWLRRTGGEGGAYAPDVAADGSVTFLRHDALGFDLHRLGALANLPEDEALAPIREESWARGVLRPEAPDAPALPAGVAPAPRPYGLGQPLLRPLAATQLLGGSQPAASLDLGLFVGDRIGRSELLVLGALGGAVLEGPPNLAPSGGRLDWTWRGLPIDLTASAWALDGRPVLGGWAGGGGLDLGLDRHIEGGRLALHLGASSEQPLSGGGPDALALARAEARKTLWMGRTRLRGGLSGQGQAGLAGLDLARGGLELGLGGLDWLLGLSGELGQRKAAALGLGGLQPGILPALRAADRLWAPALPALSAEGGAAHWLRVDLRTARDALGLFVQRGQGQLLPGTGRGNTALGLDLTLLSEAQPIGMVPGLRADLGLACTLQDPTGGWRTRPCRSGQDWGAWLSVRLLPGSVVAYP